MKINIRFIVRIIFLLLALLPLLYWQEFYQHFYVYLTGTVISEIITREWKIVFISIAVFVAFLIPLSFRRRANWMEFGLVTAFFVSLFVEMYGIPFTILFASRYFYTSNFELPENVINFTLFGVSFGMDLPMFYGAILMCIGGLIIAIAWITLYLEIKKNSFVKKGIYHYSRHPQYLGFILIILGWFIGWPTIITVLFSPILIYKYIKVCLTEEKEMILQYPNYQDYKRKTPFFI